MPGEEAGYANSLDLYPKTEEDHAKLLTWTQQAFTAADTARSDYYEKWRRWYGMRRSYITRPPNEWRSRVFIPHAFSVIETIVPKLIAQIPGFLVNPVGPDDVLAAKTLETMMNHAATNAVPALYVELVKMFKSALTYGTGMLKTFHQRKTAATIKMVPVLQDIPGPPTMLPDPMNPGSVLMDPNGQPILQPTGSLGQQPTGQYQPQKQELLIYDGPAAEWVDVFNFWPAPEAQDVQTARYCIHRTYKEMSEVMDRVREGIYHLPPEMGPGDIFPTDEEPLRVRQDVIGLGNNQDTTRRPVELMEYWTDDGRVITMANRKAILRHTLNPFDHQEKPFVRVVDYLMEGEFWGMGEIEAMEGLQDLSNALVNQRIDNVRLVMNKMYGVNIEAVSDTRELESRPGGFITVQGDRDPREVLFPLELGDVTGSAFAEAEQTERMIEKVSGVSGYQLGIDAPSLNDTATGIGLIQEAGNTKFALKMNLAEMMGLRDLSRQWGSLIQQFTTQDVWVRMYGIDGQWAFQQIKPDSIVGSMDFDIESASSSQTESVRKEQAMTLAQVVAGLAPQAVPQLVEDLLKAFGVKDLDSYLGPQAQMRALMNAQMQQMYNPQQQALPPGASQVPGSAPPGQPPGTAQPQQGPFAPQAPNLQVREQLR